MEGALASEYNAVVDWGCVWYVYLWVFERSVRLVSAMRGSDPSADH